MGSLAGKFYGAGMIGTGNLVKRTGQILTDPFGANPKGKTVVDANNNMYQTVKGVTPASTLSKLRQEDTYQSPSGAMNGPAYSGPVIPNVNTGASSSRTSQSLSNMIGKGWNDVSTKDASSALKSLSGDMGMLSKARDAYLKAAEDRKIAKENAITGNKQLVDNYQTKDLRNLGTQLRSKVLNTNLALGAAGSGSAGMASARALAKENAVSRSNVLTDYGDEMSRQNQQESLIEPEYQSERTKAYDWEERNKRSLVENYNIQKKALDRLKSKVPDWKKKDLENENDNNLQGLLQGLASIEASAKSYRDNLYSTYYGMADSAAAMGDENLGIQGPAELQTPEFDPNMDMSGLEDGTYDATDYYRPNTLKKKTGKSIFDNPLIYEEQAA
jgi:hypothetical protein